MDARTAFEGKDFDLSAIRIYRGPIVRFYERAEGKEALVVTDAKQFIICEDVVRLHVTNKFKLERWWSLNPLTLDEARHQYFHRYFRGTYSTNPIPLDSLASTGTGDRRDEHGRLARLVSNIHRR